MRKKAEDGVSAKRGRPPKELDKKQFEKLCALQATLEEIAGFFDCDENTVNAWCNRVYGTTFSEVFKSKSAQGKLSLRRTQFKLAEKSAAMAIFLGKNMLGQTDKVEQVITEVEDLSPLAALLKDDTDDVKDDGKDNTDRVE